MKQILKFSKEKLNGVFVNFDYNDGYTNKSGSGQLHFEGEEMYVLQDLFEGLEPETMPETSFEKSFIYNKEWCKIYEISFREKNRIEAFDKIKAEVNSKVHAIVNAVYTQVEKSTEGKLVADYGSVVKSTDQIVVGNSKEEVFENFVKQLETYIVFDKKHRETFIKGGARDTNLNRPLLQSFHGMFMGFKCDVEILNKNITICENNVGIKTEFEFRNSIIRLLRRSTPIQSFGDYVFEVQKELDKYTSFNKGLRSLIDGLDCDEKVRIHISKGDFNKGYQFVSYNPGTKCIEYTPKGKQIEYDIETGKMLSKNRQEIKIHKFFNAILDEVTTEYNAKCIADGILSIFQGYKVTFYKHNDIPRMYSTVNTRKWVTSSCMDRKAVNFFELYDDKPFSIGIITRKGEIVGRFIRVRAKEFTFNDRLYYKDEAVKAWYRYWCDQKGHTRKAYDSYDEKETFYSKKSGEFRANVTVKLSKHVDSYAVHPYMDTLSYSLTGMELKNNTNTGHRYMLADQYGSISRVNMKQDVVTKAWIDDDIAVKIDFGNNRGEHTTVDNLVYSASNGGHCLK